MNTLAAVWWELLCWRWLRNVGSEVAAQHSMTSAADERPDAAALLRQMWRIQKVARWVPRSRCLDQAVTLIRWARRHRITAELCIGVRPVAGQVHAHAWVQAGDQPIDPNPETTQSFQRLRGTSLPEHFTQ